MKLANSGKAPVCTLVLDFNLSELLYSGLQIGTKLIGRYLNDKGDNCNCCFVWLMLQEKFQSLKFQIILESTRVNMLAFRPWNMDRKFNGMFILQLLTTNNSTRLIFNDISVHYLCKITSLWLNWRVINHFVSLYFCCFGQRWNSDRC